MKIVNALFWALTAIPVYLLARRLVSSWWAVLAAGLAVAIPSSISVATVMTESMAYLAAALALYATMLALERPTVLRQFLLLAAIGIAFLTRSQLGVLYVGWLAALGLHWWISPGARPEGRAALKRFWPSALPLVAAVAVLGARLVGGSSPRESLGAYWELWRGYDPFGVAKWVVYHLADIEIYLAVVPLAVAPIVLTRLVRSGRAGDVTGSAFASLFLGANATGLLVVAAFTSTPWGYDRLHDRYAFYLLPLWLIVFVVWLADGLPRPLVATATGVALALVLPAILPFRQLANEAGIDTVPGALWVWVEGQVAGPGPLSGTRLLALFVIALLVAAVLLPRRAGLALAGAVVAVFAVTSILAWERLIDAPEDAVFAGGLERSWIDVAVPEDARVTKLYLDTDCGSALQRHALFLTEAFNETVDRAAYIGDSVPDGLPIERVDVGAEGALELSPGNVLTAEYVFTQPGVRARGRASRDRNERGARPLAHGRAGHGGGCDLERRARRTRLRLAHPPQVAARIEGDEELLALAVDLELVRLRQERLDRLERSGHEVLANPPDVRVLDDHVAADGHERRVGGELLLDMALRVVRVEDDEDRPAGGAFAHLPDHCGIRRRAAGEVRDPRMPG